MSPQQIRTLKRVSDMATPPRPLYWEPGDGEDVTHISPRFTGEDIELSFYCVTHGLVKYPRDLYIDEDGNLMQWNGDTDKGEPVSMLHWRFGDPATSERYYRICYAS